MMCLNHAKHAIHIALIAAMAQILCVVSAWLERSLNKLILQATVISLKVIATKRVHFASAQILTNAINVLKAIQKLLCFHLPVC